MTRYLTKRLPLTALPSAFSAFSVVSTAFLIHAEEKKIKCSSTGGGEHEVVRRKVLEK